MTQYFTRHPAEIDEAALLDNASRFKIFWRVILPLTLPAQATLGIFTFLHAWNDYLWPLISGTRADVHADGRPRLDADQFRADRRDSAS